MSNKKRLLLVALAAAVVLGTASFALMAAKDQTYVPSNPFSPQGKPNREVAVVYYSRSGHSEAAAREIARTFNAPIARIDADYPRDFSGQGKAISDAKSEAHPPIRVEPIELAPARRVFLVSPIWLFRPATPLWAYVEQTDLKDKEVVLVTTGNSRFEQADIDAFGKRIDTRGGRLIRHVFLRRGRIFWQKSRSCRRFERRWKDSGSASHRELVDLRLRSLHRSPPARTAATRTKARTKAPFSQSPASANTPSKTADTSSSPPPVSLTRSRPSRAL